MTFADLLTSARRFVCEREEPEHRSERRRFLIWALMVGAVPPERVVERVVAEVEREATERMTAA